MQTRVDRTVFERTDFGSFGWIAKVPESLFETEFFAAISSLANSFMAERSKEMPFLRPDFGSFGWLNKVPGNLWEVPFFASTDNLSRLSFRTEEAEKFSFQFHGIQPVPSFWTEITGAVPYVPLYRRRRRSIRKTIRRG